MAVLFRRRRLCGGTVIGKKCAAKPLELTGIRKLKTICYGVGTHWSIPTEDTPKHSWPAAVIRLVVLQLGNFDLTSSAGALMVKMLAAVADFERDLIIERTQAGQARARAAGTHMGRPSKTTPDQQRAIREALAAGAMVSSIAAKYQISRATVISIRTRG